MSQTMFTTNFKKNMGHNFMILSLPSITEDTSISNDIAIDTKNFRIRMLQENHIDNLLITHVQSTNNIPDFYYDITSLQSLSVILDNQTLNYDKLCPLFTNLYNAFLSCDNYLLKPEHILFDPDYIFLTPDFTSIQFCYFPFTIGDPIKSIRALFDYLLKKVDHKDEQCVYLAYTMHNDCEMDNFSISSLYTKLTSFPNQATSNQTNYSFSSMQTPIPSQSASPINHMISESPIAYSANDTTNKASISDNNINYHDLDISEYPIPKIKPSLFQRIRDKVNALLNDDIDEDFFTNNSLLLDDNSSDNSNYGKEIQVNKSIHYLPQNTKLTEEKIDSASEDSSSIDSAHTILLSAPQNSNSHMLINLGKDQNETVHITHYPFTIGKSETCDYSISNPIISRLHARIIFITKNDIPTFYIEDLNSTNGTLLNNLPLTPYEKTTIKSGDELTFGHLTYIFR